ERCSGSLRAQADVEWVADKMQEMETSVTVEKTTVPNWVRGKEDAVLTRWPGMPPGTTQKIVVTALGNSAPTSEDGLTANVMVVGSFAWRRPMVWRFAWSRSCAGSLSGRRRLSTSAHRADFVRRGSRQGSRSCNYRRGCRSVGATVKTRTRDDATHSYLENSSSDKQLQRNRGLEGVGTPRRGCIGLRTSGFMGSWDRCDRRWRRGRYFNADPPFVAVTEHPSKTHNPFRRLDE